VRKISLLDESRRELESRLRVFTGSSIALTKNKTVIGARQLNQGFEGERT
jgi:hypothetical protein